MATPYRLAPQFSVKVDGYDLPYNVVDDIVSIKYTDQMDGANVIEMTLNDRNNVYMDSQVFRLGAQLELFMGYDKLLQFMNRGEIVEINPDFGANGPMLNVRAFDVTHRLAKEVRPRKKRSHYKKQKLGHDKGLSDTSKKKKKKSDESKKRSRVFKNMKDHEIVLKVLKDYNIYPDVDKFGVRRHRIKEKGLDDFQLLLRIAAINSCYFWVDYNPRLKKWIGHFKKRSTYNPGPIRIVTYGSPHPEVLNFKPLALSSEQKSEIKILSLDRVTKAPISYKVSLKNTKDKDPFSKTRIVSTSQSYMSGSKVVFQAFGQNVEIITNKHFKNAKEAKIWAESYARNNADNFIRGNATIVGAPHLRARNQIQINGLGNAFTGLYEIERVEHNMTGGPYVCVLQLRKVVEPIGVQVPVIRRVNGNIPPYMAQFPFPVDWKKTVYDTFLGLNETYLRDPLGSSIIGQDDNDTLAHDNWKQFYDRFHKDNPNVYDNYEKFGDILPYHVDKEDYKKPKRRSQNPRVDTEFEL